MNFVSGVCEHCNTSWLVPVVNSASYKRRHCSDTCRKAAYRLRKAEGVCGFCKGPIPPARNWNKVPKLYCSRKCKERAWWKSGKQKQAPRPKVGDRKEVVDIRCPECTEKVRMDSEPLTGRTVQTCGCGTRFLGRWA